MLHQATIILVVLVHHSLSIDTYSHVGCFRDKFDPRAMPESIGHVSSPDECFEKVRSRGWQVFGTQYGQECWSGEEANVTYWIYGNTTRCKNNMGSGLANDVYIIHYGIKPSASISIKVPEASIAINALLNALNKTIGLKADNASKEFKVSNASKVVSTLLNALNKSNALNELNASNSSSTLNAILKAINASNAVKPLNQSNASSTFNALLNAINASNTVSTSNPLNASIATSTAPHTSNSSNVSKMSNATSTPETAKATNVPKTSNATNVTKMSNATRAPKITPYNIKTNKNASKFKGVLNALSGFLASKASQPPSSFPRPYGSSGLNGLSTPLSTSGPITKTPKGKAARKVITENECSRWIWGNQASVQMASGKMVTACVIFNCATMMIWKLVLYV